MGMTTKTDRQIDFTSFTLQPMWGDNQLFPTVLGRQLPHFQTGTTACSMVSDGYRMDTIILALQDLSWMGGFVKK